MHDDEDVFVGLVGKEKGNRTLTSYTVIAKTAEDEYLNLVRARMICPFEPLYAKAIQDMDPRERCIMAMNPHIATETKKSFFMIFCRRIVTPKM